MLLKNSFSFTQTCLMIFGWVALFFALQVVGYLGVELLMPALDKASLLVYGTLVSAILVTMAIFYGAYRLLGNFRILGGLKFNFKHFIIGLIVFGIWLVIGHYLANILQKTPMTFMDTLISTQSFPVLIILVVVIAPIYEELLFRGVIFGLICHTTINNQTIRYNTLLAIVISSLLFAMVHLQYDGFGFMLIFSLAMVLGWVRYVSGSIVLPIILHMLNNALAMGEYLFYNN